MTINVLVCNADGTQTIEKREVSHDWLPNAETTSTDEGSENAGNTEAQP